MHLVERLSELVRSGTIGPCEFIDVKSESGAMLVAVGAAAVGARTDYCKGCGYGAAEWPCGAIARVSGI